MQKPREGWKIVLARDIEGRTEQVEWIRHADTVNLDKCYSSLSFFDADGMRFHLPAYLVADLEDRLQTADVVFHLVHWGGRGVSQFETLSAPQREAVRAFLLLQLSDANRDFYHPMIEAAVRDYWTADTAS